MSVSGVFSAGRPVAHPNVRSILKYLPRPRVPWQPSQFNRENMLPEDLYKFWGQGRYRDGYMNFNSGYYAGKTHTLHEKTYNIIPKAELEKFMPDISIGSKALVTPVSLMNARAGHRVTHDLLHSYDKYIGRVQTDAVVDHDNINPYDPNHVGLNAATVGSAARIYRWLRRGPFFQENHYFRRSLGINRETGVVPTSPHEGPLMLKIIRLARKGHLKAAAEEYRKVTSIPPVAVYRALTAACIPHARLADAIAIFEDGDAKLFYVSRDGEVLCNLMRCAIAARHRRRVMWIYNILRGRFYENVLVRVEVEPVWQYRIIILALEYLLDINAAEESRILYDYLVETGMIDYDVHLRIGQLMQEALKAGKTIEMNANIFNGVGLVKNAKLVAPEVAMTLYSRHVQHTTLNSDDSDNNNNSAKDANTYTMASELEWNALRPMCSPMEMMQTQLNSQNKENEVDNNKMENDGKASLYDPTTLTTDAALAWMHMYFTDVNVEAIMRLARFKRNKVDLMARRRSTYLNRAARWIELLSEAHRVREEVPLPYLMKSRPSLTNEKIRVAYVPLKQNSVNNNNNRLAMTSPHSSSSLLAHTEGYSFYYTPSMRMVNETFEYTGDTLQARYLAQIPHHSEIPVAASFHTLNSGVADSENVLQRVNTKNLLPSTSMKPLTLSSESVPSLANYTSSSLLSSSSNPPHVVHDSVIDEVFKNSRSAFSGNANNNNSISGKTDRTPNSDVSSESLVSSSVNKQATSDSPEFERDSDDSFFF